MNSGIETPVAWAVQRVGSWMEAAEVDRAARIVDGHNGLAASPIYVGHGVRIFCSGEQCW